MWVGFYAGTPISLSHKSFQRPQPNYSGQIYVGIVEFGSGEQFVDEDNNGLEKTVRAGEWFQRELCSVCLSGFTGRVAGPAYFLVLNVWCHAGVFVYELTDFQNYNWALNKMGQCVAVVLSDLFHQSPRV